MTWDEIAKLFVQIEALLIRSLGRNLKSHKKWEEKEGFEWPAWQAEKLASMKAYREQNKKIMETYKGVIRAETEEMLREQYREGREASFFDVNDRRMDRLLEDVLGREDQAETAALRMMDDVYRQTVYKAEIAMAAGATTFPQAIDMAVEDYLARGITCIEYKNGSRHNIADYAFMVLQTSATRAYLQGEAKKREHLGVDTVLVSQYGGCSKTCLPWQGRVYIDDVFGDFGGEIDGKRGKSKNGKWYPLLSVAVEAGLFHPNCRHTLTTWYEGISTMPEPIPEAHIRKVSTLEQKQRYLEKKVREAKRRYEFETDLTYRAERKKEVKAAQAKLRAHVNAHDDVLRRAYWREQTHKVPLEKRQRDVILVEKIKKEAGIRGVLHRVPEPIDLNALGFDDNHINSERGHNITEEQAHGFIINAKASVTVWKGQYEHYYSDQGVAYVNRDTNTIRTAFGEAEFDDNVKKILEVLNKYGED